MSDKCKASYKNLNSIKSYSEQAYATVQWAQQACMNDEWLRQQVEKLSYLTPPAVRKRFAPVLVDDLQSYGHNVVGTDVFFSNSTDEEINIDFQDMDLIDLNKSDCAFDTYMDNGETFIQARVPIKTVSSTDTSVKNHDGGGTNSYWYVGFDKNKNYQLMPDWINDHLDHEIPSVCRAQTITIPNDFLSNGQTGKLVSVDLQIENNGTTASNWGSPLIVQVFKTQLKHVEKTWWSKSEKKNKSHDPKQYEDIYWPVGHPHNALATGKFQPNKTNPCWQNILFDKAVEVKNGDHLAIVMLSPLSHWEHCPRIGGWGRNCAKAKDLTGDAFLSENNGRSWIRYGRNDNNVKEYKMGQLTPSDFAYKLHIDKSTSGFDTDNDYYLYLKPILTNPIKSLKLSGLMVGETTADQQAGKILQFEFSTTGHDNDWHSITVGGTKVLESPSQILFIRAKLSTNSTAVTPNIEKLSIDLKTELPKEMYVRTHFYNPKLAPMLGAALWGRIFAPFEASPHDDLIKAEAEIIQDRLVTEHFTIISVSELDTQLELLDNDGNPILDRESIENVTDDNRAKYLYDNPSILTKLKKHNVYVKPYTLEVNGTTVTYYLSFDGGLENEGTDNEKQIISGLELTNSPAYPIQECLHQPYGGDDVVSLGEWYDYTVNYDDDIITLDETILENLSEGALAFTYNPVFLQNLSAEELGQSIDEETGLISEGLILDYFKEEFIIDENNIESRRVSLRCAPVDPIRQVIINKDSDNEKELHENVDFNVDYDNNEIVFPIVNTDNQSSILKTNDSLEVVYTPNLPDTGIAIGYRVLREDTNHQITIKPNYIEYKV